MDLLRNDAELPSQVGNPPFVLADEVVPEQLAHEAQISDQRSDPVHRETTATARRNEPLFVEFFGDLRQMKSLVVEFPDAVHNLSPIAQLCIGANWSSNPVLRGKATLPDDRDF